MRIACLVTFVVVGGGAALADYAPLELRSLFGASDLAVIGTIETVETDVFTMIVDEVVFGSYDGDSITITKFRDWTCASRWTPYERGQHILVFLWRQLSDGVTHYRIRGAGDDGELPIVGSYAYCTLGRDKAEQRVLDLLLATPLRLRDRADYPAK